MHFIFQWAPSSDQEICSLLRYELLVSSQLLHWRGKKKVHITIQSFISIRVVDLGDVVNNKSQRLSKFEDAKQWLCIPPNYGRNYKIYHCAWIFAK